jgi:response regulator RpfG family c-di-GMP phosphodiesterase
MSFFQADRAAAKAHAETASAMIPSRNEEPRPSRNPRSAAIEAALPDRGNPTVNRAALERKVSAAARPLLDSLLKIGLLSGPAVEQFLEQAAEHLPEYTTPDLLGAAMVQAGLLTHYQLDRVLAGTTHGLIFGNHRVLNRLGSGAMGVVFLAEHMLMRRHVAVKVLPVDEDCPAALLERFSAEMCVLAELHHPNIVMAFDAGHLPPGGPRMPALLYLVMELVRGGDLEQYAQEHDGVEIAQACEWVRQTACGLQEAHDRHLIHRDIKPSNLLLTEQGQVKLVDFGLVRQFCSNLTDPRALLGTLEFMAPEQSCDPSLVDSRADIYSLGATLFWLLTLEFPYPPAKNLAEALRMLQSGKPRHLRELRPDAPPELDALIDQMLSSDPTKRPAQPITVMNALLPFTLRESAERVTQKCSGPARSDAPVQRRVLIVDDEESIRVLARSVLTPLGYQCEEVTNGSDALKAAANEPYDLVLLDLNLPDMDGFDVCHALRERPVQPNLKILVVSGRGDQNHLADSLPHGADDYVAKPFGVKQLAAKAQHALRLKDAQDQADFLTQQLLATNTQLENSLASRTDDVRRAQDALLFAMAKMAEARDGETSGHLRRLQQYTRLLAEQVGNEASWEGVINNAFLEQMERCVPLHDIGKIGLPDHILLKPGKLTAEERALMQTHTVIGHRILLSLAQEYGESLGFLGLASSIVRHHHERYDGSGYPDGLAGEEIPAAARLVAVADVYDALRRRRFHKSALSHPEAARIIREGSAGHFDPALLEVFARCEREFERIYLHITT